MKKIVQIIALLSIVLSNAGLIEAQESPIVKEWNAIDAMPEGAGGATGKKIKAQRAWLAKYGQTAGVKAFEDYRRIAAQTPVTPVTPVKPPVGKKMPITNVREYAYVAQFMNQNLSLLDEKTLGDIISDYSALKRAEDTGNYDPIPPAINKVFMDARHYLASKTPIPQPVGQDISTTQAYKELDTLFKKGIASLTHGQLEGFIESYHLLQGQLQLGMYKGSIAKFDRFLNDVEVKLASMVPPPPSGPVDFNAVAQLNMQAAQQFTAVGKGITGSGLSVADQQRLVAPWVDAVKVFARDIH